MNLKIAPEQLRYRVSPDEFSILLRDGALVDHTLLGNAVSLQYEVRTDPAPTNADGQLLSLSSSTYSSGQHKGANLVLTIYGNGIAFLIDNPSVKKGLVTRLNVTPDKDLNLSLEIDRHRRNQLQPSEKNI